MLSCVPSSLAALGPDFSRTLLKKVTLVKVGGDVAIECKPKASPKPVYAWKKGRDRVRENERYRRAVVFPRGGRGGAARSPLLTA